jgi:glycosyltransferase involved in cell wall biosynthesis
MKSVSVIVPVYNHAATAGQAIDSALAQEFDGSIEIVAVNDGSTDGTQDVLDSYGSRIKAVRQANRGNGAARNVAIAHSSGEYLALLDADDIWLPGRLAKTVAALEGNPAAVMSFSDSMTLNEKGEVEQIWKAGSAPTMEQLLRTGWTIFPSSTTIRRAAFDATSGFEERLRGLVTIIFFMVLREQGEFEYIPEPLIIYRATPFARMADRYLASRKPFLRIVKERFGPEAARNLAADTAQMFLTFLMAKASTQKRDGAYLAAIETLMRAIWLTPSYAQKAQLAQQLIRYAATETMSVMRLRTRSGK